MSLSVRAVLAPHALSFTLRLLYVLIAETF